VLTRRLDGLPLPRDNSRFGKVGKAPQLRLYLALQVLQPVELENPRGTDLRIRRRCLAILGHEPLDLGAQPLPGFAVGAHHLARAGPLHGQ